MTLEFNGSCASIGSCAGVVLISFLGKIIPKALKLEFKNTKNTTEYQNLLLGLEEAKRKEIKLLRATGNAELMVKQV